MPLNHKPPFGTRLNLGHPLCRDLRYAFAFNEPTGSFRLHNAAAPLTSSTATQAATASRGTGATVVGQGVRFDNSTTAYLELGDTGALAAANLTVIMRVRHDGGAGTLHTLLGANDAVGNEGGIAIYRESSLLSVWQGTGNSASVNVCNGAGTLSADRWYTVAVRRRVVTGTYFYTTWIDGRQDDTGSTASAPFDQPDDSGLARIGFAGAYTGAPWSGWIDWAYVWLRPLGDAEVPEVVRNPWQVWADPFAARKVTWFVGRRGSGAGTFAATGSLTTAPATAAGTAAFAPGTKTATGALAVRAATAAGSATHTPPTYSATAALSVGAATAAGSATFAPGTKTANGTLAAGAATASGSATFSPGTKTASGAVTVGAATAAGSATFAAGTRTATGAVAAGAATASGSAAHTRPAYTGSAAVGAGAATASGSALFATVVYQASGALAAGAATAAGTAAHTRPTYVASGALNAAPATAAGSATRTPPVYAGAAAWAVGNVTCAGVATFAGGARTAAGPLSVAAAVCSGSATFSGGSVTVPAAGDVLAGIVYDAANPPAPGRVRAGVVYG